MAVTQWTEEEKCIKGITVYPLNYPALLTGIQLQSGKVFCSYSFVYFQMFQI